MSEPFTIHKHVGPYAHGGWWTVERGNTVCGPLHYSEMLGVVAKILLQAKFPPYPFEPKKHSPLAPLYSLHVTTDNCGHYTIRRGPLFTGLFCEDEALGFIAAYTITDGERQLYRGLGTYERWSSELWNCDQEIAGLITYQPELIA